MLVARHSGFMQAQLFAAAITYGWQTLGATRRPYSSAFNAFRACARHVSLLLAYLASTLPYITLDSLEY